MKTKDNQKFKNTLFQVSAVLILVASVLFNFAPKIAPFMLAIGAAGYAASIFTSSYLGESVKGKRLYNYQIFSSILFAVSAYLMFVGRPEWVYTVLAGALLTLYCAIKLPQMYKKEQQEKAGKK